MIKKVKCDHKYLIIITKSTLDTQVVTFQSVQKSNNRMIKEYDTKSKMEHNELKSFKKSYCNFSITIIPKDQLISKCPFGVFKSPKEPTNFFQDFSLKRGQIKKK